MSRFLRFGALILILLSLAACSARYRIDRDSLSIPSPWPFARGSVSGLGAVDSGDFPGRLDVIWKTKSGDKPAGPLTIYHGALVYPGTKKKVRFYDLVSGENLGILRTKGIPQTGVVMSDSLAFFCLSPKRNRLYAVDLVNQRVLWRASVKDAAPGSIILSNRLLISSGEGTLIAVDTETGETAWRFTAEGRFVASASAGSGNVFQPSDRSVLHVLSPEDGHEILRVETDGPLVSAVAVADLVYAADVRGHVYAIDPDSGRIIWRVKLEGPIWTTPVVLRDRVFVGHSGGWLVALDAASGRQLWRFETGEVIKASPLALDSYVVVGTMGGRLLLLDASNGRLLAKQQLRGAIAFPPVTDGRRVFVATQLGRIAAFGEQHE